MFSLKRKQSLSAIHTSTWQYFPMPS